MPSDIQPRLSVNFDDGSSLGGEVSKSKDKSDGSPISKAAT